MALNTSRDRKRKKKIPHPSHTELKRNARLKQIKIKRMALNKYGLALLFAIEKKEKKKNKKKKTKKTRQTRFGTPRGPARKSIIKRED